MAKPTSSAHSHCRRGLVPSIAGEDHQSDSHGDERSGPDTLSAVDNESEHRRWNDPVWVAAWPSRERLDRVPSRPTCSTRSTPGRAGRVCDIGCGGGSLTIAARRAVAPRGRGGRLRHLGPTARARPPPRRRAGCRNVRFVEMDVQTGGGRPARSTWPPASSGSCSSTSRPAAFAASGERLTPAGRLVFACWQGVERNPWHVGHGAANACARTPDSRRPGRARSVRSPSETRSTCASCSRPPGYATVCGDTARDHGPRRRPAPSSDRSLFGLMGVPPDHEEEARAMVERHLERFASTIRGDARRMFEFPLAFMVYEATRHRPAVRSWPATAAPRSRRSSGSPRARPSPSSMRRRASSTVCRPASRSSARRGERPTWSWRSSLDAGDFERRIGLAGQDDLPRRRLWVAWPKRSSGLETT